MQPTNGVRNDVSTKSRLTSLSEQGVDRAFGDGFESFELTRRCDVDPLKQDVEESEDRKDNEEERSHDGDGDEAEDDVDRHQVEEEDHLPQHRVNGVHVFGESGMKKREC